MHSIQSSDHRHLSVCAGFASEEGKSSNSETAVFTAVIKLNL